MFNRLVLSQQQADSAIRLFGRFGYNGAPLDQVAAALELTSEQVYAEMGGRSGLFLSLLHHCRSRLTPGTANFAPQGQGQGLQALERLFVGLIASQADADLPPAYLIIATASEIGTQDLVLNAAVQAYFDELRQMLANLVRRAALDQEVVAGVDCDAAGDFLFGALLALRMLHKINAAPLIQRNFVSGVMHYLQRLRPSKAATPHAEHHSAA